MINTLHIKQQQIYNGYFKVGSGATRILIIGSCRAVHILNYLNRMNTNNQWEICFIDPFNWNWDIHENRVDYEAVIRSMETNQRMLELLSGTKIYIHEFYNQYGMFNSSKENPKNIYQFGLNPNFDICLPNFNDVFILYNDFITFDSEIRDMAKEDAQKYGRTSFQTLALIKNKSVDNIEKFLSICAKTDFPDMAQYFEVYWTKKPLFYTYNHTSKYFTLFIFERLMEKLMITIPNDVWHDIEKMDLFASPRTAVTDYDVEIYGLQWR